MYIFFFNKLKQLFSPYSFHIELGRSLKNFSSFDSVNHQRSSRFAHPFHTRMGRQHVYCEKFPCLSIISGNMCVNKTTKPGRMQTTAPL